MVVIDFRHTVISPEEFRRIVGLDRQTYRRDLIDGRIKRSCSGTDWQVDLRFHSVIDVIEYVLLVFLSSNTSAPRQWNVDYCEDLCEDLVFAFEEHDKAPAERGYHFVGSWRHSTEESHVELPEHFLRFICLLINWCLRRVELILGGCISYGVRATVPGETRGGNPEVQFVVYPSSCGREYVRLLGKVHENVWRLTPIDLVLSFHALNAVPWHPPTTIWQSGTRAISSIDQ